MKITIEKGEIPQAILDWCDSNVRTSGPRTIRIENADELPDIRLTIEVHPREGLSDETVHPRQSTLDDSI